MWYVIQTITGKEQELVEAIEKVLGGNKKDGLYRRCFILERECTWRIGGRLRLHVEPLFPSYVFAETDHPELFFIALKKVLKHAKLLGDEESFWSVGEEEERFLCSMIETAGGEEVKEGTDKTNDGDPIRYLVRRSFVRVDTKGQIVYSEGVLKRYMGQIVKQRLRKRSVIIEIPFFGELRRINLGIRLEGDPF